MIRLKVITPTGYFLNVQCEKVTLPGFSGELEALSGHTPLLLTLKKGLLTYLPTVQSAEPSALSSKHLPTSQLEIDSGFAEISQHQVTLLCEEAAEKAFS